MDMLVCPKCKLRVIPKADGTCPSCQAPLKAATVRVVQKADGPARETPLRPVDVDPLAPSPVRPARVPRPASSGRRTIRQPVKLAYGEVLRTAAGIAWRHKILWLAVSLVYLFIFSAFLWLGSVWWPILLVWLLLGAVLGTIATLMCILGTLWIEQGQESLQLGELLRASLSRFWRMVGTGVLAALAGCLVAIPFVCILAPIMAIMDESPSGTVIIYSYIVLSIPVNLMISAFTQQCYQAAIVEDCDAYDAIGRGGRIFMDNLSSIGAMAFCLLLIFSPLYLLTALVDGKVPGSVAAGAGNSLVAWSAFPGGIWVIAVFLVFIACLSWLMVFYQSTWTLTFLRLTRRASRKA